MASISHVMIISENEIIREGIKRIISEEGISTSCAVDDDKNDIVDQADYVFLVETDREHQGLEISGRLRQRASLSKIVLMCPEFKIEGIRDGFEAGINGFITKNTGYAALMCKLALIVAGEKILPVSHVEEMLNTAPISGSVQNERLVGVANLSEREVKILECLVNGDANKMISRRLNIAEPTVKVHVKSILRKLQLTNRTQAAIWAVNHKKTPMMSGVPLDTPSVPIKAVPLLAVCRP